MSIQERDPHARRDARRGRVPVRVATFNIHHGADASDDLDLERTAAEIDALAADVLFLQEVDRFWARSGGVDQPAWLAERLGMHVAFAPALKRSPESAGAMAREYGHLILSRAPLKDIQVVGLPQDEGTEPRAVLIASTEVRGVSLRCAGVHLDAGSGALRRRQASALLDVLPRATGPLVLAGDFNATPASRAFRALSGRFIDAWGVAGSGGGVTLPVLHDGEGHGRAGDALRGRLGLRIDHVLVEGAEVVDARVEVGSVASDHLPLAVDLEV